MRPHMPFRPRIGPRDQPRSAASDPGEIDLSTLCSRPNRSLVAARCATARLLNELKPRRIRRAAGQGGARQQLTRNCRLLGPVTHATKPHQKAYRGRKSPSTSDYHSFGDLAERRKPTHDKVQYIISRSLAEGTCAAISADASNA